MNHYSIVKNKFKGKFTINYDNFDGFKVKPRNQVKHGGIAVTSLTVTNQGFIDNVLKRKTKKKLDLYLKYIISIIEDEGSTDPTGVRMALDDLQRYKSIIDYRYRKYLDEKYVHLLLKKIELLERELKTKMVKLEYYNTEKVEEKSHRSR